MLYKKIKILLCAMLIGCHSAFFFAMERVAGSADMASLSGPFNVLVAAMQPFFEAKGWVDQAQEDLSAAVESLRSALGKQVGVACDAFSGDPQQDRYAIDSAIREKDYERILAFYELILGRDIAGRAWGLLDAEVDMPILYAERIRIREEVQRMIDTH